MTYSYTGSSLPVKGRNLECNGDSVRNEHPSQYQHRSEAILESQTKVFQYETLSHEKHEILD